MSVSNFEKQVLEDLTEIKTKMNVVVGEDGNGGRLADFELRMRAVERRRWRVAGMASAISALLAGAADWCLHHFSH